MYVQEEGISESEKKGEELRRVSKKVTKRLSKWRKREKRERERKEA
jgi:hypothetical protein